MNLPVILMNTNMENFRKENPGEKILMREELEWILKIFEISIKIENQYGKFSTIKEEMPLVISNAEYPEVVLKNLEIYYNSLTSILNKNISESLNYHQHASKIIK